MSTDESKALKKTNLHAGHRNRVKERFLSEGLSNFSTHNILELLLFYSIPQKDTNEIAHHLTDAFGSLSAVLEAEPYDLKEIPGIGEHSAILIKLVQALAREYLLEKYRENLHRITSPRDCYAYLCTYYLGIPDERIYGLFFDPAGRLIAGELLAQGISHCCDLSADVVARAAVRHQAASIILSHNHPNGLTQPSPEDIWFTEKMEKALDMFSLQLLDHIIVADGRVFSILFDDE